MFRISFTFLFLILISCTPNTNIVKKSESQTVNKVLYGTIKSSTPVKIESEGMFGTLVGGVIGGIVGAGNIFNSNDGREKAEVYGAVVGAIIGYISETKLGSHDGFQYIIDVNDDEEDISIVQVGKEVIKNETSVVVVIGDNVIVSPYNG